MSLLAQMKKGEARLFCAFVAFCHNVGEKSTRVARKLYAALGTSVSIVVFTETSSTPRGYCLRLATVLLLLVSPFTFALGSAALVGRTSARSDQFRQLHEETQIVQKNLDEIRDATSGLQKLIPSFEVAVNNLSEILRRNDGASASGLLGLGLGSQMTESTAQSSIPELEYLARTLRLLEEASRLLEDSGAQIAIRQRILQELPSLWPVEGNLGYITTYFGASINPFTGLPYLHKGLDIANARQGDPVVATADGKVVTAGFDPGYGNMVILQHPNGYFTRYGHMQSLSVRKGEVVKKGSRIGKIGNTGLSTGAHVHYEVIIGGRLSDPLEYIDLPRGR